jgi:hypothetical protein
MAAAISTATSDKLAYRSAFHGISHAPSVLFTRKARSVLLPSKCAQLATKASKPVILYNSEGSFEREVTTHNKQYCYAGHVYHLVASLHIVSYNVTWLSLSFAGLSPRRPGFSPRSVYVGFVVDSVALGQVFLRVL